jgi:fluoroquinolone transport system permease protein
MKYVQALRALAPIDAKSIGRDPLLRWMILYPLLMAALVRWGVPALTGRLQAVYQFDLSPYYLLLMSFVVLMTPMLTGMVIGFLLLDEKDARTLTALQVTPLTLNGYLVYRITVPILLSFAVSLVVVSVAGLVPVEPLALILSSASAAFLTPFYALFLAAFATNKVQGFALTKGLGVLLLPPLAAYFVDPPLQWLFGLVPLFWPVKQLWLQGESVSSQGICFVVGLCYQTALLALLLRRFQTTMQR